MRPIATLTEESVYQQLFNFNNCNELMRSIQERLRSKQGLQTEKSVLGIGQNVTDSHLGDMTLKTIRPTVRILRSPIER